MQPKNHTDNLNIKLRTLSNKWAKKYEGIEIINESSLEITDSVKLAFKNNSLCLESSQNFVGIYQLHETILLKVIKLLPILEKMLEGKLEYVNLNKILDELLQK